MLPTVFYLHGFLSGPGGNKAAYLSARLAEHGLTLRRPDLNVPDFEHMTLTHAVAKVAAEVEAAPPGPVVLIGSSLGGLTALQFLKTHRAGVARRVEKLVLLAPAFEFPERFVASVRQDLGPDVVAAWRAAGSLPMYHYAYNREMPLGYGFVVDLASWSDGFDAPADIPTLILHGMLDDSVPYTLSARFAAGRPAVRLHLFGSGDHGLGDTLPELWDQLRMFLGLVDGSG
jgi:pimeloyl-ACP methyl ester carboxylesterase